MLGATPRPIPKQTTRVRAKTQRRFRASSAWTLGEVRADAPPASVRSQAGSIADARASTEAEAMRDNRAQRQMQRAPKRPEAKPGVRARDTSAIHCERGARVGADSALVQPTRVGQRTRLGGKAGELQTDRHTNKQVEHTPPARRSQCHGISTVARSRVPTRDRPATSARKRSGNQRATRPPTPKRIGG